MDTSEPTARSGPSSLPLLRVVYTFEIPVVRSDEEPEDFVEPFDGGLFLPDDETGAERSVGRVWGYRVRLTDARDAGFSDLDVFDTSGELLEYYEGLPAPTFGDVLIVAGIRLEPSARGQGAGLLVLASAVQTFGRGCQVAAIMPWPLRDGSDDTRDGQVDDSVVRAASARLYRYWQQLGFKKRRRGSKIAVVALTRSCFGTGPTPCGSRPHPR